MTGALTHMRQALGKNASKASSLKVLLDGNLAESLVAHGPGGTLVGEDANGNKYFEKKDAQSGRHRWVVYANASTFTSQDPTTVPPEWHGWLHAISDENPANHSFNRPIYAVEAKSHPTMSPARHMPKGAWENPNKRTWLKFEKWNANQSR